MDYWLTRLVCDLSEKNYGLLLTRFVCDLSEGARGVAL